MEDVLDNEEASRRIRQLERRLDDEARRTKDINQITAFDATAVLVGLGLGIKAGSNITLSKSGSLIVITGVVPGAGASTSDAYVTIGHPADLTAERALTGGVYVSVTDGGANNAVTVDASLTPLASALFSKRQYIFAPDAAPGVVITAGNQQGNVDHSDASGETASKLYVDAATAPGAAGLPITIQYGDTNDLDTVSAWTTIATYMLSSEKSNFTTTMANAAIPASRLIRMNIGTIVGAPKDATVTLETKVALTT